MPRRVAAILVGLPLLTTLTMLGTYHVGTDAQRALVVRWGLPGFEALPGVGAPAVVTDWHESQLPSQALPRVSTPAGFWLSAAGDLRWGRQLAVRLEDPMAALSLWRLGDDGTARERLLAAAGSGQTESVETAAYIALHEPAFAPLAVESGLAVLASSPDSGRRRRTLDALECLPRIRPTETGAQVEDLARRLENAPTSDLPTLIEALSVLAGDDPEPTRRALSRALERLSDPDEQSVNRLADAVRRLLVNHPGLAAQHHDDVLALARRPEQLDRFLGWVEALAGDASGRSLSRSLLLDDLRLPGPGRAAGLALLGRLLDRESPLAEAEVRLLDDLADETDPEVLLTGAKLIATLPAPEFLAARFEPRLTTLTRRADRPELARRAVAALAELKAEQGLVAAADLPDDGVRGSALRALVELALSGGSDAAALSAVLARGLQDPAPWIRHDAARGILLLADRLVGRARDLYDAAFDDITAAVESDPSWVLAQRLGDDFAYSSAAARVRFCRHLAHHLVSDRSYEAYHYNDLLHALLDPGVAGGGELVSALAPLFADRRGEIWAPTVIDRLRARQRHSPQDFAAAIETLMADLADGDLERRRGAAGLLGPLAARSGIPSARVLNALAGTLSGPDPLVAANAAASLFWLARDRPDAAQEVVDRLSDALADERLEVRLAVAETLSHVAELPGPAAATPPDELERALADPDPAVRGAVALAVRLWSQRASSTFDGTLGLLARRLELESEPTIRARLAVAAALISSGNAEPSERWFAILARSFDDGAATEVWWEIGALAAHRPGLAPQVLELVRVHWRDLEDPRVAVLVVREMGRVDADAGRAGLELLAEMLLREPGRAGWDALINGVKPIASAHPELLPQALAVVEQVFAALAPGRDGVRITPILSARESVEQAAWSLWIDLSVTEAVHDRRRLWRGLASASRGDRRAALEILTRLAADHPELRPELGRRLAANRRSLRPEVRLAAAMAEEALALLRFAEDPVLDPEARRLVLAALPDVGLGPAMSIAHDRLSEEESE